MSGYTASIRDRRGRVLFETGDHETRDGAARAAFAARPSADRCSTGFGYRGGSDIQWINRRDTIAPGRADYESDVARRPTYDDGSPRRTWEQLDDVQRWSWNRPHLVD